MLHNDSIKIYEMLKNGMGFEEIRKVSYLVVSYNLPLSYKTYKTFDFRFM